MFGSAVFLPCSLSPGSVLTLQRELGSSGSAGPHQGALGSHQPESSLQKGNLGTTSFPGGILASSPFSGNGVCSFPTITDPFHDMWFEKEEIIDKMAFITTWLSHALLFFLTSYEE